MSQPQPEISSRGPAAARFPDDPEMAELAEIFLGQLPVRIDAMRHAWQEGDLTALRFGAHQLRGAAGGYGFPEVGVAAGSLEDLLRVVGQDRERIESALAEVERCWRSVAA